MFLQIHPIRYLATVVLFLAVFVVAEMRFTLADPKPCVPFPTAPPQEAAERYLGLAEKQFQAAAYGAAIASYDCAVQFDPDNPAAYYGRGLSLWKYQRYEESIQDFNKAIDLGMWELERPFYMRGYVYFELKEYAQAIQDFTHAIDINDQYALPYLMRARGYEMIEDNVLALDDYSRAIVYATGQVRVSAYVFRGDLYRRTGYPESALADLNAAVKLDRNNPVNYYYRGMVYDSMQMYSSAISDYTSAIALDATYGDAYYFRGLAYSEMGLFEAALRDYEAALAYGLATRETYYSIGLTHLELEQHTEAIESLSAAIEVDPSYKEAYYVRGLAYAAQWMVRQAIADYLMAIGLDPNYAAPYRGLGTLYDGLGWYRAALWGYQRYVTLAGADANQDVIDRIHEIEIKLIYPRI